MSTISEIMTALPKLNDDQCIVIKVGSDRTNLDATVVQTNKNASGGIPLGNWTEGWKKSNLDQNNGFSVSITKVLGGGAPDDYVKLSDGTTFKLTQLGKDQTLPYILGSNLSYIIFYAVDLSMDIIYTMNNQTTTIRVPRLSSITIDLTGDLVIDEYIFDP